VLRNGLLNLVVPPLLDADDIENTASPIVACWTVFTELLPGNALLESVTYDHDDVIMTLIHLCNEICIVLLVYFPFIRKQSKNASDIAVWAFPFQF
jgi:hypothetical protein